MARRSAPNCARGAQVVGLLVEVHPARHVDRVREQEEARDVARAEDDVVDEEHAVERDLDLFRWIAGIVESTQPRLRRLKPVVAVETFAESLGTWKQGLRAAAEQARPKSATPGGGAKKKQKAATKAKRPKTASRYMKTRS